MNNHNGYLSTGEAAAVCRCSKRTVANWLDNDKIKGFYVPGSRFRRINIDSLRAYMIENGVPTDLIDQYAAPAQTATEAQP